MRASRSKAGEYIGSTLTFSKGLYGTSEAIGRSVKTQMFVAGLFPELP